MADNDIRHRVHDSDKLNITLCWRFKVSNACNTTSADGAIITTNSRLVQRSYKYHEEKLNVWTVYQWVVNDSHYFSATWSQYHQGLAIRIIAIFPNASDAKLNYIAKKQNMIGSITMWILLSCIVPATGGIESWRKISFALFVRPIELKLLTS